MIRPEAARKLAETLLDISIVHVPLTEAILDMAARQIVLAVSLDEQRQRTEQILKDLAAADEARRSPLAPHATPVAGEAGGVRVVDRRSVDVRREWVHHCWASGRLVAHLPRRLPAPHQVH